MIKKCLFPVAGRGTRFLPITKSIPKEMLPILTKPLIHYAVKEAMSAKCESMVFVTSKNKNTIEDYFDSDELLDEALKDSPKSDLLKQTNNIIEKCDFSYTRQKSPKGLGDAILCAKNLIQDEAFLVILPDDLYAKKDNVYNVSEQLLKAYEKYPNHCIVAIEKIDIQKSSSYGIIKANEISKNIFLVEDMVEKPQPEDAPSDMAIIGRYILTAEIFDILEHTKSGKNNEIQITDALLTLAKQSKVIAVVFDGLRFDCGEVNGYLKANNHFYQNEVLV